MSDQTRDGGGRLWARPEAPDLATPPPPAPGAPADLPPVGPQSPPPLPRWWAGFAAVLAAYALLVVLLPLVAAVTGDSDGAAFTITGTYLQDAALLGMALLFARLGGGPGGLPALGWRRVPRPLHWLGMVVAFFVGFYVIAGVYGSIVGLGDDASQETVDALGLETSDVALAFSAVLLTVVAPIVEESVFRGLLFGALWRWKGWVFGAVISGLVFGAIHAGGADARALPVLAFLGFGLALLYWWSGSLLPGIALHALNNSITLAVTVDWPTWARAALVVGAPLVAVGIAWTVARPRSDLRRA